MRRLVTVACAAALVVVPLAPVARAASVLEAEARASVLFSTVDVQPSFDPALADSRSSSSTIGTSSLQSVVWPSFLVDAFFFLYGFQSVERIGLGIAEARFPQGPEEADATHSDLLFVNGGDPDAIPGKGGKSHAEARESRASGGTAAADATLPGGLLIDTVASKSDASTTDDVSIARATQEVMGAAVGPLAIETIRGAVEVRAGETPAARSRLVVVGATVAGTPVELDDEGVRAFTDQAQARVDDSLAGSGISVRLVPGGEERNGEAATATSGGVLIEVAAEQTDPTGTPRNVKLAYLLGSAHAAARATSAGSPQPPAPSGDRRLQPESRTIVATPSGPVRDEALPTALVRRRTIITTATAAQPIGARGAYAAILVVGLGVLGIRPLVRAAARA
jgi:hypothetical protein